MQRFARVLRAPDVARLLGAAVLARMPIGIDSLGMVLFVRAETGSFARAGLVAAAFGHPLVSLLAAIPWRPRALLMAVALAAAMWGGMRVAALQHRALVPGPIDGVVVVTGAPSGDRAVARVVAGREDVLLQAPGYRPQLGGIYRVTGRLREIDPTVSDYYASQGVHLALRGSRLVWLGDRGGGWGVVDSLHRDALHRLGADGDPPADRALVAGVTLGETGTLPADVRAEFRTSGLYHLVSVYHQGRTRRIPQRPAGTNRGEPMHLAGYVRVSRVAGREGASFISPSEQTAQIEAYCALYKHTVTFLPAELDVSGGTMNRPILGEAIQLCKSGERDGLIVAKLDRFARTVYGALDVQQKLAEAGAVLISVGEQLDTTTSTGKAVQTILLAVAELERDNRRETFATSRRRAVERGVHVASKPPTGYQRGADSILVPDPAIAPHVHKMFQLRAESVGISAIRDYLQEHGVTSPYSGKGWTDQAIRKVLQNRAYTGEARSGENVNPTGHEAIVTEAEWKAAQPGRVRGVIAPARSAEGALLSTILRCQGCRHSMKADRASTRSGQRQGTYKCRKFHASGECPAPAGATARIIDEYVVERFFEAIQRGRLLGEPTGEDELRLVAAAESELFTAEDELREWLEAVSVRDHGRAAYAAALKQRQARVDDAERSVAEALGVENAKQRLPEPVSLRDEWPHLSTQERRQFLATVFDAVILTKGHAPIEERVQLLRAGELAALDFPRRGARVELRSFFPNTAPRVLGPARVED